jgi:hypothetical protein
MADAIALQTASTEAEHCNKVLPVRIKCNCKLLAIARAVAPQRRPA